MSSFHNDLDLALKSPTTKDDLNYWICYRSFSKFFKKLANALAVWLGERYVTVIWPILFPINISQRIHSEKLGVIICFNFNCSLK